MTPTVSIIVPVYNAEASIRRCVDSILGQQFTDFELLLVDDGSKDSTGAICDAYAAADSRVRVFHKENSGVSDTRNQGIQQAQGVYLQFLDSDDWITPDATKLLVQTAEVHSCDLVISDFYRVVGERVSRKGDIDEDRVLTREEYAAHMMEQPADFYYGVLWNKLYRRDLIQMAHIRFEHVVYAEDQLFNTRYLQVAQRFAAIDEAAYCYIQNPQSVCHTQVSAADMLRHRSRMYHTYKELCIQLGVYDKFRLRLHGIYLSLFESPLPNGPVQKLSDAFARTHSRI